MQTRIENVGVDPARAPGEGGDMVPAMALALRANFASVVDWRRQFVADVAGAGGRRVLAFVPRDATLVNLTTTGADALAGDRVVLLTVDLSASAAEVATRLERIDWAEVYRRYQAAVEAASEPFGASFDQVSSALVIDARRAEIFEQSNACLPGARWLDPAAVGTWGTCLPTDREVVVYCVYGHEVGRATALRLRALGIDARFLRGGIDGWSAAGRPIESRGGAA
jgi:Fe-Mn family superoxide dismutase